MMVQTVKKLVFPFLIVILANCGAFGLQLESVRITAARKTIEVGEPLVIKIIDKYQEPVGDLYRPFPDTLRITVEHLEGGKEPSVYTVRPENIRSNLERTEFICSIMLWYDGWGADPFQLIFTKPGKYEVYRKTHRTSSNKLNINVVQASPETMAALALLSDPKDMKFLRSHQLGPENRPARIAKLLEVVKQSDTTLIGQMAAARLGLDYYEDFRLKNRGFDRYRNKRKETGLDDPLLDKSDHYLKIARKLPDDMLIRERVIHTSAIVKFLKDDLDNALVHLDEIIEKYPNSDYGRKAFGAKAKLMKDKEQEKEEELRNSTDETVFTQKVDQLLTLYGKNAKLWERAGDMEQAYETLQKAYPLERAFRQNDFAISTQLANLKTQLLFSDGDGLISVLESKKISKHEQYRLVDLLESVVENEAVFKANIPQKPQALPRQIIAKLEEISKEIDEDTAKLPQKNEKGYELAVKIMLEKYVRKAEVLSKFNYTAKAYMAYLKALQMEQLMLGRAMGEQSITPYPFYRFHDIVFHDSEKLLDVIHSKEVPLAKKKVLLFDLKDQVRLNHKYREKGKFAF